MTFCLPTKCRYIQTTLFGTILQEKVGTICGHRYEQFIGITADTRASGRSKATLISDGQVILLDIRGVTLWGVQLNVPMMLFNLEKIVWRHPLN